MKKNESRKKRLVLSIVLVLVGMFAAALAAQALSVAWWNTDGSGAQGLSGGTFTLSGTAGQPDAGILSAGNFTLNGGFWFHASSLPSGPMAAQDWMLYR
ncbi:hypothetical protein JW916_15005 [Candidatus Sumerlaeota bacterium]|nr:hypothetical protein [Candidatus Sumerlaeota bacterium]